MDRRKRLLVNSYEVATDAALREVAEKHAIRVLVKPRVADTLDIEQSGISNDEFSYALKAHFDFVVIREDATPLFAVEVDGPQHTSDTLIKHHDGLKNSLCKKLGMPLIRMDAEFLRRVGAFSIIGWIIEMWLLYEDWQKAQQRVEVPIDEPFLFFAFPGYDPFAASRAFIHQQYQKGACITPVPEELHVIDPGKGMMMLAFIHITDEFTIIGQARCRSFMFPAIPSVGAHTLSQELAVVDAAEKFKRYLRGHYQPATREEVQAWRAREASWKDIIQFFDTI